MPKIFHLLNTTGECLGSLKMLAVFGLLMLAGCNFNNPQDVTPTVEDIFSPTPSEAVGLLPSPSLTPSPSATLQIETATATNTTRPSETPTATETLGPYVHVIQENDTLFYIIQLYGYRDLAVVPEVVLLNNLLNADTLPPVGSELLIPRQTATPVPTPAPQSTSSVSGGQIASAASPQPSNPDLMCYTVQAGDTIVGIAEDHNTTIERVSQLNPDLNWFGCDFSNYSGGPQCNPSIFEGQCINVPTPTPTPTLSPTPSGSETATPTPTYPAPVGIYPAEGGTAPPNAVILQWVGVGVLKENEFYLVQVDDITTGQTILAQVTKQTKMEIPASKAPTDGQTHTIHWRVSVASPNEQGVYRYIGGESPIRSFQWQSR
jgi:hypothetical protein